MSAARSSTDVETIVVGGGQAGLAAAYHLTRRGREFVVLDAGERAGESWRRRWDSLQLFTPAGFSHLPGWAFPARRDAFATKDEMADYLAGYARHHSLPVEHGVRVTGVERLGADYLVTTAGRTWRARNVIAATGAHTTPRVPASAAELDEGTLQLSSVDYRRPSQVPPGPVLVVGAGNSGAEIALDLARARGTAGPDVSLSGRDVGHIPGLGRASSAFRLMQLLGGWGAQLVSRRLGGSADPLGRVRPADFREACVARLPRVVGVRDGRPLLADGTTCEVSTVIWCTGLRPDFGWVRLPVLDAAGVVRQEQGLTEEPGFFVLGQPYQRSIASHLVGGVGRDAAHVVDRLLRRPAS
ncbi:flavin-containing monooxygenase [Ornithinimicrobium cavernae]|uniref:flavin-containing monooxygenase n=1 Tax=Ornithinimicrobium cavernae TaxID=2666047 RepID=UPI00137ACE50|nr:FAD-dependent oxidoreductase [Ornithinimicrobium cavernae]